MDNYLFPLVVVEAEAHRDLIMAEGPHRSMSDSEDGDIAIDRRSLPSSVAPELKEKLIQPHITKWFSVHHRCKSHGQKYVYFCERCKVEVSEERFPCLEWPVVRNCQLLQAQIVL
jgi:hypothetical protein